VTAIDNARKEPDSEHDIAQLVWWCGDMDAERLANANPLRLLDSIQGRASLRKLRLLACACSRLVWESTSDAQRHRSLVEIAERFADGLASADELRKAHETLRWPLPWIALSDAFEAARDELLACLGWDESNFWIWERQLRRECRPRYTRLVADVFEPLLSRPVAFDANWSTSTAVTLAQQMYDSRDFSTMPILADALQDAGCDNADILDHCRGQGPHVRGCWVVDLVLGKE
jgi:hypothetical protein